MGEDLDIGPVTQAGPVGSGSGSGSGQPGPAGMRRGPDLQMSADPGLSEVG